MRIGESVPSKLLGPHPSFQGLLSMSSILTNRSRFMTPKLSKNWRQSNISPDSVADSPSPDRLADIKIQQATAASMGFDRVGQPFSGKHFPQETSSAPVLRTQGRMPSKELMYVPHAGASCAADGVEPMETQIVVYGEERAMPTSEQVTHHAVMPYAGSMPSTLSQHPAVSSQATAMHPSGPNHYVQMTRNEMHVHGVDGQTFAAAAAAAGTALGASQAQAQAAVAERDRIAHEAQMKKEWDERTIREREAALHQQQIWNASVSAQHQNLQ